MIVGIDLGTSTSEIAILKNGRPHLIREVLGSARGILPSVVGLNSKGRVGVGEDMVSQLLLKPELTVQEVKRKMGSGERIQLGGESYTPQEISSFILRHLKEEAERYLGEPVTRAVITVPAYFTDVQRRATEDAGELAGLEVCRLIAEPTAAALAYGIERPGAEELVLVYDLGGGTLDVTVLELSEGVLDVIASTGNSHLGGKDFDESLMAHVATSCRRRTGIELLASARLRQKLKAACKRAKETLSSTEATTIVLDSIGTSPDGDPVDFEIEVTRATFESLIRDLVYSTREQISEALGHRTMTPDKIGTVLLVGGSTRIPLVRQMISDYFGGRILPTEVSPDEAVSLGAAVLGGIIEEKIAPGSLVITDVTSFTLGVAVMREIDGEDRGGFFAPLILKQSTIPRTARETFRTARDWQDAVHVQVFQGDAELCADNEPVTTFQHPMKPAPAGAQVEIEFTYNLNGTVDIVARDVQTAQETRVSVRPARLQMSEAQKEEAKRKLDRQWQAGVGTPPTTGRTTSPGTPAVGTAASSRPPDADAWRKSPLYQRVSALLAHAEKERDKQQGPTREKIARLVSALTGAVRTGDAVAVDRTERELTDVLFDLS